MFATLIGGLPRPDLPEDAPVEDLVSAVVEAQVARGLEPVTDGRLRWPDRYADVVEGLDGIERQSAGELRAVAVPVRSAPLTVESWRSAASLTERAVKQALPGPYTLGRRLAMSTGSNGGPTRRDVTIALARALREEILDLRDAGCPLVEIEERDGAAIGDDRAERDLFLTGHDALTAGIDGVHLSLSLTGPSADRAGASVLHASYASYAFDLIEAPDGWRLVVDVPSARGVVCGALATRPDLPHGPEILLYAAGYAASTKGRGMARVGLALAGGLELLDWATADALLAELGDGVRIVAMEPGPDKAGRLDPRAIDIRSAALGRYARSSRGPKAG